MNKTDYITHIRSFTNFSDPLVQTDDQIMRWVFMGETHLNENLRIADMVQIDTATITNSRVSAPSDFIAADLVIDQSTGLPMTFEPRHDFYANGKCRGRFTQSGNFLVFGGTISDTESKEIELHYFGDVPHLTNAETWLSGRFNALETAATLAIAFAAMEQADDATIWETSLQNSIVNYNNRYQMAKGWGQKMKMPRRPAF